MKFQGILNFNLKKKIEKFKLSVIVNHNKKKTKEIGAFVTKLQKKEEKKMT